MGKYTVTNLDTDVVTTFDPAQDFAAGAKKPIKITLVTDRNHPLAQVLDGRMSPQDYMQSQDQPKPE